MDNQRNGKYIPLNAGESAELDDADTLLPRDEVYEPLAIFIKEARNKAKIASSEGKSLNEVRSHNSISIDGARGSGKTAIQVNLKRYLELKHPELMPDVHILEPIDPTLLEDGESLFLHIVVASVLHDSRIKEAQSCNSERSNQLNQALNTLAHALEAVGTQKERQGLDKVRSMYSNKHLADSVQTFFFEAVRLLDVKLLVLPIDDVDTSLNLAFENLEIIRRYLTTPYVLPIVSGDRSLFHEVTWRDFHGRLTKDSAHLTESAYKTALELSEEYQRKVLPFPRRLSMPEVSSYWQWNYAPDGNVITLGNSNNAMPLPNFISWLEVFLTGPVNGQENSRIPMPIPSIRALVQLVNHCRDFIPQLPTEIRTAKNNMEVRRAWQMPNVPLNVISAFEYKHKEISKEKKRDYADAYKVFADAMPQNLPDNYQGDGESAPEKNSDFAYKLSDYFRFEPKAGAVYLLLIAQAYWKNRIELVENSYGKSIFDTPLFQPLLHHNSTILDIFDKASDLSEWSEALNDRLPQQWLDGLKAQQTILPYPVPEIGINTSQDWNFSKQIELLEVEGLNDDIKSKASFLIDLLAQHNFYTNAKKTQLLNIGRIFELIITSIVRPIEEEDLHTLLNRAPFFSAQQLAPTKTLNLQEDTTDSTTKAEIEDVSTTEQEDFIGLLPKEINDWRYKHNLDQIELSPWLVYKVFNKVYSQAANSDLTPNGMKHIGTALNVAAHTFYSTWFAFGSFEKGELFGLPDTVARTNIVASKLKNFEQNDHFKFNVGPFTPTQSQIKSGTEAYESRKIFGQSTRTISYVLADHPLKKWIDEVIAIEWPSTDSVRSANAKRQKTTHIPKNAKEWLCYQLAIIPIPSKLTVPRIKKALSKFSINESEQLIDDFKAAHSESSSAFKSLEKAIEQKRSEQS